MASPSPCVLLTAKCVAECLVSSIAHPVLTLVNRPEAHRISCISQVALANAGLHLMRNLAHVALDDVAVVVGQVLTLGL